MKRTLVSGWNAVFAMLLTGLLQLTADAQLPVPELTTLYPPGGKQGATVEVTAGGANLEDAVELLFSDPGIQATVKQTEPTEFTKSPKLRYGVFDVHIDAGVSPGVYDARVISRFGASSPRSFVVGGLEEMIDDGSNKSFATAKVVNPNTTVNGRTDASAVDYYKLPLKQGQRVLINCWARRIDSRLDAALVLYDSQQKELARSREYTRNDPMLDFTAPLDGEYVVALYDFVYSGGAEYFYRLDVHERPYIDFVAPPVAKAGAEAEFVVYGRNLPGGEDTELRVHGAVLQKKVVKITAPAEAANHHGVGDYLPTNGIGVDGFSYRLDGSNSFRIGFATADTIVNEQEPNNDPAKAQQVTIPCEVAGRFHPRRDSDWIQFEAKKGDVFWIEVISHRLGLDTDPYLMLQRVTKNDKGEEVVADLAQVDDPGDRNGAIGGDFDTSTDDPSYKWTADSDATYRVMVRDQLGDARSDPRMAYRLAIRKQQPDFRLFAFPQQVKVANNNQVLMYSPVVRKGGATLLRVDVQRHDGFADEISLTVEGLPAGVVCKPASISAGAKTGWLVLEADENAQVGVSGVKVVGKSKAGAQDLVRIARPAYVVWSTANRTQNRAEFRVARDLLVSVCDESAQASAAVGDGQIVVTSKGGAIELPIKQIRRGYAGDLKLVATAVPAEIKPADVTLKADAKDPKLAWTLTNAKAKPGVYTFYLRGDVPIKHTRNPAAMARAEQEQKEVAEAVTQVAELVKQQTTGRDAAVKAAQEAAAAATQAQQKQQSAAAAAKQAAGAAKAATDLLTAAKQAAAKDPGNQALADALKAAEKAGVEATAQATAAAEQLSAMDKLLAAAQIKAKAMEEAKAKAEQTLKEAQEKQKRAAAAKTAADKQVADVKKANAPKAVNIAVISSPITLRIVESPLDLSVTAPPALKTGQKVELPISVKRLYGFADAVEVTLEPPKGAAGLTVNKLTLAKDQSEGKFEIAAADNATPGDHQATVRVKAQFNKVPVETVRQIVLKVEKAAP